MNVLITGSSGFIGKNLKAHLNELSSISVQEINRETSIVSIKSLIKQADFIVHLAGANRPDNDEEFNESNVEFTHLICQCAIQSGRTIPIIFSSSTQAEKDNAYGVSKYKAEKILTDYSNVTGNPVYIFRLPNVMGKWCKPNYNSVVATFCHNISHDLPIDIHNENTEITLVYIDDLIREFLEIIQNGSAINNNNTSYQTVNPEYLITLGELAKRLSSFKESRENLITEKVGVGLDRALYATYLSYLDFEEFSYPLVQHVDERGTFVEFLKTRDSGQISFLTAHPGITRGIHYHHSKSEKFVVLQGQASFRYKKLFSDKVFKIEASQDKPVVIETIPGWVHDITNIGSSELVVLVWASEQFSQDAPDTFHSEF